MKAPFIGAVETIFLNIPEINASIRRKTINRADNGYWKFTWRNKTATGVSLNKKYFFTEN